MFKPGYYVYCPMVGPKIYKLKKAYYALHNDTNQVCIEIKGSQYTYFAFNEDGKLVGDDSAVSLWPATIENQAKLSKFYEMNFESPLVSKTALAKDLFDHNTNENFAVLCWVSNVSDAEAIDRKDVEAIIGTDTQSITTYYTSSNAHWTYAVPVTGEGEIRVEPLIKLTKGNN